MLCAISGEAPQVPVASRKSGNVFERRLIEQYIRENGTDPVNGETLDVEDLIDLKQARIVRPRPPTQTSIPALLATFQNEWDALILETYQLKQQLAETRQELSTSLYYNDSAEKVIARLQRERDDARDALSKISISSANGANGSNGDAMQLDGQALPESVVARIEQTQQELSATRRKRPVPSDWATAETMQSLGSVQTLEAKVEGARTLAVSKSGDLVLVGGGSGTAVVYSISQSQAVQSLKTGGGAIVDGIWWGERPIVATSTGSVVVFENGKPLTTFNNHAGAVISLCMHPCGDILASVGADKSFVFYDLQSLRSITQQSTDTDFTCAAFHPDGHLFATGTAAANIRLYDAKTLEVVGDLASSSPGPVQALEFSENGTWLAALTQRSTSISIWDLRKLAEIKSIDIGTSLTGLAWDYTGQFLAACGPGSVVVQQYSKSSKAWSEPFRKAANAVQVRWGLDARSLIALSGEGTVTVFAE